MYPKAMRTSWRSDAVTLQELRGRLWRTFLHMRSERASGAYSALVNRALGPQFQSFKVGFAGRLKLMIAGS